MAMAEHERGAPKTARVWLTDGSPARFSDVQRLRAMHRTLLGLPAPYKGVVDPAVPVGSATIKAELADGPLFAEAEWTLAFAEGIQRYLEAPDRVDLATPVVMQGLIEGKWLNRMLATLGQWRPGSLGNNLLAEGPGIPTTIGAIEGAGVRGEVEVSYTYARDGQERTRAQRTTLADLRGQNVLGLVREVLRVCRGMGESIDAIDLSAMGEGAAVVNERRRFWAAARFEHVPLPDPRRVFPLMRLGERVVRGILAEGIGVPPGNPITIVTRDRQGTVVGQGTLTWQARQTRAVPVA